MKLIFATNNAHKLEEARKILPDFQILSLNEIGLHADIPETSDTLLGNSQQKSEFVYDWCVVHAKDIPADVKGCFADDTGLEIAALGGAPGVYTARWAGEDCNPAANKKKALSELAGEANRLAQFRTVVTYILWDSLDASSLDATRRGYAEGVVSGSISTEERGEHGFGYDPVFIPEGYADTFAELPTEVKNGISHRARAMQAFKQLIQNL